MKLLVCGGRDFTDRAFAFQRLDAIHAERPITEIIEGGARGGDALARAWSWQRLGKPSISCPADWADLSAPGAVVVHRRGRAYNANAGFARNQSMLDEHKPDACLPFPGGAGTADMLARARFAGVEIL